MPDILGKAAAWLEGQRHRHLTVGVWFERDGKRIGLEATVGRTRFEGADGYGRVTRSESRDYLVRAQDLVLDGVAVLPRPGDLIIEADRRYEVMSPEGEPEWRWSDANQSTIRIHTRQTGEEEI